MTNTDESNENVISLSGIWPLNVVKVLVKFKFDLMIALEEKLRKHQLVQQCILMGTRLTNVMVICPAVVEMFHC